MLIQIDFEYDRLPFLSLFHEAVYTRRTRKFRDELEAFTNKRPAQASWNSLHCFW